MDPTLRALRHDLRGHLNSIVLCTSVIPITTDRAELLQFIDEIDRSCDQAVVILDKMESYPESAFEAGPKPPQ